MQKSVVPVAAALAFLASACGRPPAEPAREADAPVVAADTFLVSRAPLPEIFEAGGVVRAKTTAAVTSRIMAPVEAVLVVPGDRVRAGQALARLDAQNLGAQARQADSGRDAAEQGSRAASATRDAARAALTLATTTHARIAELHGRRSATDSELDAAVAQLREAEAQEARADAGVAQAAAILAAATAGAQAAGVNASWAIVSAPFDGIVTEKLVETGNMASPGMPLFRIEQQGGLRLEVRLDESRATLVTAGQGVDVFVDAPSSPSGATRPLAGRIAEIAQAFDAGAHAFLVKVDLPADVAITSGTYARVRFAGPARSTIVVPRAAVLTNGQLTSVFAMDGDRARLRLVSVGADRGDTIEVIAGLDDGDRVVRQVTPALADGVRIGGGR